MYREEEEEEEGEKPHTLWIVWKKINFYKMRQQYICRASAATAAAALCVDFYRYYFLYILLTRQVPTTFIDRATWPLAMGVVMFKK